MPYICTMYKSVYGGAIFIATKILLYPASSTSWFSLIMEIPEERNMERSRDVKKSNFPTAVEGDPKAPFSLASTSW